MMHRSDAQVCPLQSSLASHCKEASISPSSPLAGVACCRLDATPSASRRKLRKCPAGLVTSINATAATWAEARAECLVHGRALCTQPQLEAGAGCTFSTGRGACARHWTRPPCVVTSNSSIHVGALDPNFSASERNLHRLYKPVARIGSCANAALTISTHRNSSMADCLEHCDALAASEAQSQRCTTIAYNFHEHVCSLMRRCTERAWVKLGQCGQWWMLLKPTPWLQSQMQIGNLTSTPCYFTRYSTSTSTGYTRRKAWHKTVWTEVQRKRAEMERRHPKRRVCVGRPLLQGQSGAVVNGTLNRVWRYFTAIACGTRALPQVCLAFKKMGHAAVLGVITSTDGVGFSRATDLLRLGDEWNERDFTHNVGILRLGEEWSTTEEYAMIGGTQGFIRNHTCRKLHGWQHRECLQLDTSMGIRLSRGFGLPWSAKQWSTPRIVLTGAHPAGCVDRRPEHTGYPHLRACEYDGRLSLAQTAHGSFLLYARANLRFGAIAGGRFVQVSSSDRLDGGWQPWRPIRIMGVDPSAMDIYTFAVQRNPVARSSLLAIFPLTEPPWACVSIAFSADGVHFSRPVTLRTSELGARPSGDAREQQGAAVRLEWRGEDHPVAGVLLAPGDRQRVLIYLHLAVKGTTIREDAIPHIRVFSLSAQELAQVTADGLAGLRTTGSRPATRRPARRRSAHDRPTHDPRKGALEAMADFGRSILQKIG